tara:strand:+ start:2401 stop:3054 length:654 start_codon:yes stop_codon:yes gene_type:complete
MNITKARLIEIIKEEVIKEAGGVAGNFGGVATELGAQRADGNDLPDHDLYGPQQTAEDNFVGILNEIGHMLDAWEKKKYPSDEARYMSYFEDLQGLLEQYDPCAHVGQKCEDVHPNQSHEECVEVTINNALYEAAQKRLNEMYPRRRGHSARSNVAGPVNPKRKLKYGEKCPAGYKLGLTDYCEKIGARPKDIENAINDIENPNRSGGYGGLEEENS